MVILCIRYFRRFLFFFLVEWMLHNNISHYGDLFLILLQLSVEIAKLCEEVQKQNQMDENVPVMITNFVRQ